MEILFNLPEIIKLFSLQKAVEIECNYAELYETNPSVWRVVLHVAILWGTLAFFVIFNIALAVAFVAILTHGH
jgi:hypothetical protein